jgi:hypothetical protein
VDAPDFGAASLRRTVAAAARRRETADVVRTEQSAAESAPNTRRVHPCTHRVPRWPFTGILPCILPVLPVIFFSGAPTSRRAEPASAEAVGAEGSLHCQNLSAVCCVECGQREGIWEASPNLRINSGNVTHRSAKAPRATAPATAAAERP